MEKVNGLRLGLWRRDAALLDGEDLVAESGEFPGGVGDNENGHFKGGIDLAEVG